MAFPVYVYVYDVYVYVYMYVCVCFFLKLFCGAVDGINKHYCLGGLTRDVPPHDRPPPHKAEAAGGVLICCLP